VLVDVKLKERIKKKKRLPNSIFSATSVILVGKFDSYSEGWGSAMVYFIQQHCLSTGKRMVSVMVSNFGGTLANSRNRYLCFCYLLLCLQKK